MDTYRVVARNHHTQSNNRIHSDDVARQYGFRGGLVPGVTVFAYMTRPVAEAWGREWLEGGTLSARFALPVYDGQEISVDAHESSDDAIDLTVRTPDGTVAATGQAARAVDAAAFDLAAYPTAPLPAPDERPPASFDALPPGTLGSLPGAGYHAEFADIFLAQIDDDLPVYKAGAVAHPGWLIQAANEILSSNVKLGPWIHVSSQATFVAPATDGDVLTTRGRVVETFERKGHKFVDLDVLVVANDDTPVMHARHQAIFEPRRSS